MHIVPIVTAPMIYKMQGVGSIVPSMKINLVVFVIWQIVQM